MFAASEVRTGREASIEEYAVRPIFAKPVLVTPTGIEPVFQP